MFFPEKSLPIKWIFKLCRCHNRTFKCYIKPFESFSKLLGINLSFSEERINKLNLTVFFFCQHVLCFACEFTPVSCSCPLPVCSFHSPNSWFLPPEPLFLVQDCLLPCRLPEVPSRQPKHSFLTLWFCSCFGFWITLRLLISTQLQLML